MNPLLLSALSFSAAAGLLVLTPGVDTAMVLRTAAATGPRGGAAASLGIAFGVMTWGGGAAFGLTALLAASTRAYTVLKWMGAAYLLYLGLKLVMRPRRALGVADAPRRVGDAESFRRGYMSNVLNPKAGVFYVTFLPQFIPAGYNVAAVALLLTGVHVALTLAWFSVLVCMTVPLGRFLQRDRVIRTLDRLTGCVFIGFGLKLVAVER